jgi:hypothetical protein
VNLGQTEYVPDGAPGESKHPFAKGFGAGVAVGVMLVPEWLGLFVDYRYGQASTREGEIDGVVRSSSGLSNIQRYVEQSTLVHELGHAIGLVNNGVPLVSAHQDGPHGAHCTDTSCVMYWQNEGASAMAAWATQYVLSNSTILFKADCLADVDALTQ